MAQRRTIRAERKRRTRKSTWRTSRTERTRERRRMWRTEGELEDVQHHFLPTLVPEDTLVVSTLQKKRERKTTSQHLMKMKN